MLGEGVLRFFFFCLDGAVIHSASSSLTLIRSMCTRLIISVSTFSSLMRTLCLSSALLSEKPAVQRSISFLSFLQQWERRGGAICGRGGSNAQCLPLVPSLLLFHVPSFPLANIKLKRKASSFDEDGRVMMTPDVTDRKKKRAMQAGPHMSTLRGDRFQRLRSHLVIAPGKGESS